MRGAFLISLDFELYWGMLDRVRLEDHRETLLGARRAIPLLLELFQEFEIHATWATVGFLFFSTREDLLRARPGVQPTYVGLQSSPYEYMSRLGEDEEQDPYHFAGSLVRRIRDTPHQEIGSHTFCHYYCHKDGQNLEAFRADLEATRAVAERHGISLESMVFPRNQLNESYFEALREAGVRAYRGKESRWWRRRVRIPALSRALRWADSYLPLSSGACYKLDEKARRLPINVRASRYLRPYSPALRWLEPRRLRRVKRELTGAAQTGQVYHLWWHPENFGLHTEQNLEALREVLKHFRELQANWGMESLTMGELAHRLSGAREEGRGAAPAAPR